jgi:hypothetical protein
MSDTEIFISSCSRRQMARRRPAGRLGRLSRVGAFRLQAVALQVLFALLVLAVAFGAFVAGHGGV